MNQTHNGPDQRALECGSLLPPWLSPIRDRELQKIDPAVVDQSESVVCQFSCVKRAILLGRRPSVLPAQGNALGTGVAKIELRPNGPTVRLRRGWAVGPSNQGRLVPFPRALPWAGRTAPLRGGGGLGGGTELGCRCQEHSLKCSEAQPYSTAARGSRLRPAGRGQGGSKLPWPSPIRDREQGTVVCSPGPWPYPGLQKSDRAVVGQSKSVLGQFSCVERAILLGRRPSVLPAQGNALGTGVAKIELRPNGPTVRLRRGWAVGPSNQVPFPRALPRAGKTAPLRGRRGLRGGTELGCRYQEHPLKFSEAQPNPIAARGSRLRPDRAAKAAASCRTPKLRIVRRTAGSAC